MRTPLRLGKVLAAATFAGFLATPAAYGAALTNTVLQVGVNEFQDSDAELVQRGETVVTSGAFQVDDIIKTILRFDTINSQAIIDLIGVSLPNFYRLWTYAELKIGGLTEIPTILGGNGDDDGACGLGEACVATFAPSGALGANVFAEVYERDSLGQTNPTLLQDPTTGIANVKNLTLIAEIGVGEADDFWKATLINDIGVIALAEQGSGQQANGEFGLSLISNAGGLPVLKNGMTSFSPFSPGTLHDFVGDASAYALEEGTHDGWLVSSNTTVSFAVPEPGTLALAGLALLGLAGFGRRRA